MNLHSGSVVVVLAHILATASSLSLEAPRAAVPMEPASAASQVVSSPTTAFGFAVGEERRYALGPPDALPPNVVSAEWSIRLHQVMGQPPFRMAVFVLQYDRTERRGLVVRDPTPTVRQRGELIVADSGFPLRLAISEQIGSDLLRTVYEFDGSGYTKVVRVPHDEWDFEVRIAEHPGLDVSVPSGLYLFDPRPVDDGLLANPGLLSLVMPMPLPPGDWERDVLLFMPTGAVRWPDGAWVRRERDTNATVRRFYDHNKLQLRGVAEIQVGNRTVPARRFDVEGDYRGGYVDELGRVLRLDFARGPSGKERWARLSWPDELREEPGLPTMEER